MTAQEKKDNPLYKTIGGYLKVFDYKEAWVNLWSKCTEQDKKAFEELPNFNAEIFLEITGIDTRKDTGKKRELLAKADELIQKANELKEEAEKL